MVYIYTLEVITVFIFIYKVINKTIQYRFFTVFNINLRYV
jgi:hypothetical protein